MKRFLCETILGIIILEIILIGMLFVEIVIVKNPIVCIVLIYSIIGVIVGKIRETRG